METPLDFYADGFQVITTAYGCSLSLVRSLPGPPRMGKTQEGEVLAIARMSLEHLKLLIFTLHRQLSQHEREHGVAVDVPQTALNGMQIGREDWEKFWRG